MHKQVPTYMLPAGLFCVMFSLIAAVGISQLQFTDMNSPRYCAPSDLPQHKH